VRGPAGHQPGAQLRIVALGAHGAHCGGRSEAMEGGPARPSSSNSPWAWFGRVGASRRSTLAPGEHGGQHLAADNGIVPPVTWLRSFPDRTNGALGKEHWGVGRGLHRKQGENAGNVAKVKPLVASCHRRPNICRPRQTKAPHRAAHNFAPRIRLPARLRPHQRGRQT
jgi:hypothetical protein